jgi:hypothetical protein
MTLSCEARPRLGDADRDGDLSCVVADSSSINQNSRKSQDQNRPPSPIICRITADLLAESVEIAMSFGVAILAAAREADNTAILTQFKGFDAASRTARRCAEELRGAFAMLDPGGA